ncbi:MAG: hypothetical protein HKM05_08860 [Spirochaetales bacterium]|nr:hypothetical protein [Spirochaetales bacterium]
MDKFVVRAGLVVKAVVDGLEKAFQGGDEFLAHEIGKTVEWVKDHLSHAVNHVEAEVKEGEVTVVDAVTGTEVPKPAETPAAPQA